jgi:DNA (cytosine-5)-methyltransferase 1
MDNDLDISSAKMLQAISLFSGAGGLDIAAKWAGIRTVCYVAWDKDCQRNLISRIRSNELDDAPIADDVCSFDGRPWAGKVDIVFGGFPCQPHSLAGKRGGAADRRNLWPECLRILQECRAPFFVGENVGGIITNGYAFEVLAGLEEAGYCAVPTINTSCASGGPFPRKRVFFIAHSKSLRLENNRIKKAFGRKDIVQRRNDGRETAVCVDMGKFGNYKMAVPVRECDGVATGLDRIGSRLKRCGNGVDPYSAFPAFQKICQMAGQD